MHGRPDRSSSGPCCDQRRKFKTQNVENYICSKEMWLNGGSRGECAQAILHVIVAFHSRADPRGFPDDSAQDCPRRPLASASMAMDARFGPISVPGMPGSAAGVTWSQSSHTTSSLSYSGHHARCFGDVGHRLVVPLAAGQVCATAAGALGGPVLDNAVGLAPV